MKKHLLALFLALGMCITPALAAESTFTDVPAGSWFQEGVRTCAEKGVMVGTGEGVFSPDTALTRAECLTLAYRLYDLQHGGDGSFLKAPEDWGKMTLTLSDGTVFEGYGTQSELGDEFRWWRDVCYTIVQKGLEGVVDPGDFSDFPAERDFFAKVLTAVAGELEVISDIETFPDADELNTETRQAALKLYRAGVLTGVDEQGTFDAGGTLTRAQAAVMVARVLDPAQRVELEIKTPDASAVGAADVAKYDSYDAAVAELRGGMGYSNERTFETDECTIFVFDRGGFMSAPRGKMVAIYKAGSALGEGTAITLPHARTQALDVITPADTMALSGDGKTFTYTYHFDEPLVIGNVPVRGAGTFTYVFTPATGEITQTAPETPTITYEQSLAKALSDESFTVTETLESPYSTILVGYEAREGGRKDYHLRLVYKAGGGVPEGYIYDDDLSDTDCYLDADGNVLLYTDRAPDTLALSKDGTFLFYSYDLGHGEMALLTGGGVQASVLDLSQGTYSTGYCPEDVGRLSQGVTVESLTESDKAVALLVYDQPQGVRDHALYLIGKEEGVVRQMILPSTFAGDGYFPTDREPDSMEFSGDGSKFIYTYRFADVLSDGDALLHDKGTYVYTVDVATGELSVSHTAE